MRNHNAGQKRDARWLRVTPPGMWWTVTKADGVTVELDGGVGLAYRLGEPRPVRDKDGPLRDERGRTALEAFTALPFVAMRQRLHGATVAGAEPPQAALRDALGELVSFVTIFGPIGVSWGVTMPVANDRADALALKVAERRVADLEGVPGFAWKSAAARRRVLASHYGLERGHGDWIVSFEGMAGGRWGIGEVRTALHPWAARDLVATLEAEQRYLRQTARLAHALARGVETDAREALRATHPDREAAARWSILLGARVGERWARALRGPRPASGRWRPFLPRTDHDRDREGADADWLTLGRLVLADLIGRHLNFTQPRIEVGDSDRLTIAFEAGSLLEHIYLELLHHVRRRPRDAAEPDKPDPYFETPQCEVCEGAILATRLRDGFVNKWHRGCRPAGKARQHRARGRAPRRL